MKLEEERELEGKCCPTCGDMLREMDTAGRGILLEFSGAVQNALRSRL